MSNIKITPCTVADLHTLQDIAINSYGDHYLYLWFDGGMWYIDLCFSDAALKKDLENPNSAYFLVYASDKLVGFLKLNISKALENESETDSLELERIYLTKGTAGKGIGKELIDFTVTFARERNKRTIWLKAMDSSNEAIRFYEQHGFQKCGTYTLDFEQMKPEYRGMVIMKMDLPAS